MKCVLLLAAAAALCAVVCAQTTTVQPYCESVTSFIALAVEILGGETTCSTFKDETSCTVVLGFLEIIVIAFQNTTICTY